MGTVALEGMEFYARHGYYPEERIIGNKYSVDVYLSLDLSRAAESDRLEGTVDYEKVYEVIADVMSNDAALLEHLAGKMIKALKAQYAHIENVRVRVSKYNPPIKGLCHRAVVEISG